MFRIPNRHEMILYGFRTKNYNLFYLQRAYGARKEYKTVRFENQV